MAACITSISRGEVAMWSLCIYILVCLYCTLCLGLITFIYHSFEINCGAERCGANGVRPNGKNVCPELFMAIDCFTIRASHIICLFIWYVLLCAALAYSLRPHTLFMCESYMNTILSIYIAVTLAKARQQPDTFTHINTYMQNIYRWSSPNCVGGI